VAAFGLVDTSISVLMSFEARGQSGDAASEDVLKEDVDDLPPASVVYDRLAGEHMIKGVP
jgi:hypothetical protein